MTPRIAAVLGDPAGVGPELIAKLIAEPANREKASFVVVGDRQELETGMKIAGVSFDYSVASGNALPDTPVALFEVAGEAPFERMAATRNGGAHSIQTLRTALDLTLSGATDGILFGPLNKGSMHAADLGHEDESQWFAHLLNVQGRPHGELNVLDGLWTTRVTSHVALKDVSGLITPERIMSAIKLAKEAVDDAGVQNPRIGVCGLNPHNGDNGNFGREEIEVIEPTVARAKAEGFPVEGPFPADTIFLRAKDYDAIVTMYHDQGQIALKLLGFSRGVTVHGGLPIPVATPAHGTAFDIYGKGIAGLGATQAAFDICTAMAVSNRSRRAAAA